MSETESTTTDPPSADASWGVLVLLVVVTFAVGAGGGLAGPGAWYESLEKPALAPPNWVFAPVWTVLYLMMATAAWQTWRVGHSTGTWKLPLTSYAVQLVLNGAWSLIFFGLQRPGWAFIEIVGLWLAIVATLVACWRITATAGLLLVPYLLWVSFAACLNFEFWRLNR